MKNLALEEFKDFEVKNLSRGQKRKLSFAIALSDPNRKFLILDEPSAGLDQISRENIWNMIPSFK